MRLIVWFGAILLLSVVGCSEVLVADPTTSSAASSQVPKTSATDTTDGGGSENVLALADSDPVSPVIEWQGGGMSSDELFNARSRALSSCMQQRGWTYEPSLQQSPFPEPRTVGELRDFRETYGYGVFTTQEFEATDDTQRAADRNADYLASLSVDQQDAYRRDLNGGTGDDEGEAPGQGSCEALAAESVSIPLGDQAVRTELGRLYEAATQSPEYLSALAGWRACLSDRGYEIQRDGDPTLLVEKRAAAGATSQELADFEIEVAVADFECALTTKMPVRHRLETEIVQELVEKYPEWGS